MIDNKINKGKTSNTNSVKRNLIWNILLTISGYIFPLLTFPYVTRVLGAGNLGLANFALSMVDYAVLFSTLGMSMVGIRYIAQSSDNEEKRSDVFSKLVSIHLALSIIVLIIYLSCVLLIPQLNDDKNLYIVGASKILMNVFLVEWLFQGMQDFRYVTIRTLVIRCIYVVGIFVFVRTSDDYDNYFYVTIAQVVINVIVNWRYSHKYAKFKFTLQGAKEFVYPIMSMGINSILLSFYGTFNVLYLGFKCTHEEVGYFTTATKLYAIFISLLTAYNGVFVPYLNSLYAKGELERFKQIVTKSLSLISMAAIPIIVCGSILAPEIIRLIAGAGYEQAVLPFQIILIQVLIVGITQILENQILLSFKHFKQILFCTASTTMMSVVIITVWVPQYGAVAAAAAVAIPHVFEIILLYYFAQKAINFKFPIQSVIIDIFICIPIGIYCYIISNKTNDYIWILFLTIPVITIYYMIMQILVVRDAFLIQQIGRYIKPLARLQK